ncbi:MAG TPA: hypothetical protein PLJ27_01210 [Polyangiaceae bacterium]|jgi:hypothetical protein|nr:MAG: hypothetical protein BWY17_01287 [Deltaproteobacteria bacterium ADurb.Bin207]HNS96646.1 hypothetical protein [Polyangiaceae bacterium]HNZ23037.1 hypothetical protein [Polyangiaceae bacterium]HOD21186.1 hypothetical protein [Polyangiaceae bacterium]HOE49050.1 hypothetical protein [Polyangiaceae bacterium]
MPSSTRLRARSPKPRAHATTPNYPRQSILVGVAMSLTACMGAAPGPYAPATPSQTVTVKSEDSRFAQPPPDDVVEDTAQPVPPPDHDIPPPGEAPGPFE